MLHKTNQRSPSPVAPVTVLGVPLGGARRYGVEVQWGGGWTGTITVQGPRGGVIHTASVTGAGGFAAWSGWADWPNIQVVAELVSGTPSEVTADAYLIGMEDAP